MAMKDDAKSIAFVEDTAVAPERLRDYIERFLAIIHSYGTTAGIYAHASVGCLHVRPVINMKTEEGVRKFEAIAHDVADLVLEFGGALSAEHGDGLVRSPFMRQMFGPALYEAFREIKRTFDPAGNFQSRKDRGCAAAHLQPALRRGLSDFEPAHVVRLRRVRRHGRRGRDVQRRGRLPQEACRHDVPFLHGDARRSALHARPRQRAAARHVREPGGSRTRRRRRARGARPLPGMPRLQIRMPGRRGHGTPQERISRRLLGAARHAAAGSSAGPDRPRYRDWASRFAPLANWFNAAAPGRWFNQRFLGIDRRRALPAWKRETFEQWCRGNPGPRPSNAQAVTLFNDTFTNHYDPEIGAAALQILSKGGCAATVVRPGCCGRPLISQGLLPQARTYAERVVTGLLPIAERGEKILFCEPSCLSAVKEDAPSLLRGDLQRKARTVADACILFEQFAATLDLPLAPGHRTCSAARALPPESNGNAAGHRGATLANPERLNRRVGCRLLRYGGIVRLFPEAL